MNFNQHVTSSNKVNEMNDQYVNFSNPVQLAQYIVELTKQGAAYKVVKETDGSHSVIVTGF